MRRTLVLTLISVVLIGGCIVGGGVMEKSAETKAKEFCTKVKVGGDFLQAIVLVNKTDASRKGIMEKDHAYVMYSGFSPFSRHFCDIRSADGKITEVSYSYLD